MVELPRARADLESLARGGGTVLPLHLELRDPEVVAELELLPEGPERDTHAARALKIGLLALRQAAGAIDADAVRREGEQILNKLEMQLRGHQASVHDRVEDVLRGYFDPESGRFPERIERLIQKDGDLERVLRAQVGSEDSTLRKTLAAQFGPESPLMKALSPSESEGLLQSLETRVGDALGAQRDSILAQFSLDRPDSALSRLVRDLEKKNAGLAEDLQASVGDVVGEFSLDNEDSALSRLVQRVDEAQRKIRKEFTLDDDASALARLKGEMLAVIEKHGKEDQAFRTAVLSELKEMRGRREERAKSTRHGDDFEADFFAVIQDRAQAARDIAARTNNETGIVPRSKKGDVVVELGPEHAAAGRRIVYEAKEDASYTLEAARAEIDVARQNRQAEVGVFVFSAQTAPAGLERFQRIGDDVFVIWDARDSATDVWLDAATEVARAIITARATDDEADREDIEAIEKAMHAIAKQAGLLDEITTWSKTIGSNVVKIQERVRKSQTDFARQVERLRGAVRDLKGA